MRTRSVLIRPLLCCALMLALAPWVTATEGGASVYPAGVETVMPGMMPAPGSTLFLEFNDFYMANGLANSKGESEVPGFHLRVGAWAPKVVHNWGVHVLGGTLVSTGAIPFLYENVSAPFGIGSKTGFGNADIQPAIVTYALGPWHWWYGADLLPPGLAYTKNAFINIGQHNFAYAPSSAFTYLPHHGRVEISSKLLYFINSTDPATNYRSGNEFLWEYDAMKRIGKHWVFGGNGFWYRQMTNDLQNGSVFGDGNRGRDLAIGPEIQYHVSKYAFILKYEKDTLVENRPIGNSFWVQFGMPIGRPHE